MLTFLQGKRTYIIAVIAGLLVVINALGYPIPDVVWGLLAACGLGTVRAAITNTAK